MRTLGLIAIGGLGIGIASLSLAYALGGRDLHRLPFDFASSASCGEGAKGRPVGPSPGVGQRRCHRAFPARYRLPSAAARAATSSCADRPTSSPMSR